MPRALDGHKWFINSAWERRPRQECGGTADMEPRPHQRPGAGGWSPEPLRAAPHRELELGWRSNLAGRAAGLGSGPSLTDAAFGCSAAPGRWC